MHIINILQQSVLKFQLKTMTLLGTLYVLKQKRLNLPQRVVKLIYEKGWYVKSYRDTGASRYSVLSIGALCDETRAT